MFWLLGDYISDVVFWLDILVIKPRIMFLDRDGIYETDRKLCTKNYVKDGDFKVDLLSVIPFDIFYIFTGVNGTATLLRANRAARFYTFNRSFDRIDANSRYPTIVRLVKTFNIMIWLIHVNACAYYAFSAAQGINSDRFVYNGVGVAYIRCFYFAVKSAMSIGKN